MKAWLDLRIRPCAYAWKMAEVVFRRTVGPGDPDKRPCTIVGKLENLRRLPFDAISPYIAPRVDEEVR